MEAYRGTSISFQSEIKARLNADTLRDREWISQRGKLRRGKRTRTGSYDQKCRRRTARAEGWKKGREDERERQEGRGKKTIAVDSTVTEGYKTVGWLVSIVCLSIFAYPFPSVCFSIRLSIFVRATRNLSRYVSPRYSCWKYKVTKSIDLPIPARIGCSSNCGAVETALISCRK